MSEHAGENAELYALGLLDEFEAAAVELHAQTCEECTIRLEEASIAVADLCAAEPIAAAPSKLESRVLQDAGIARRRIRHAPHWQAAGAIAAALLLAFIPAWVAVDRTTLARSDDNRAIARLAAGPFNRATFMSPSRQPMDAKVLYGPHGNWYYVVVMHPAPGMHVAYVHGGRMEMLGTVSMHGESGSLYLPINHKMEELALLQGSRVVADARLVY
ncbi:MAG TPA: hypothetical protein VFA29_04155 [Candidatus Baltobacteraceae bacterium]|nr:hypothetical protein [Candidatus Baltobacteraceae bacterium]